MAIDGMQDCSIRFMSHITLASRSSGAEMRGKVRSQLMPLRPTSPSLVSSPCAVLPRPSPVARKKSVEIWAQKIR